MSKELLNEAERFLLEHWEDAKLLEDSMKGVRTKYKEVFERIIEAVTESHPELNANAIYLTQSGTSGEIGFGRMSWPDGESGAPSGLWVKNLRLELLTSEDADPPYAYIWVPKKFNLDYDAAWVVMKEAAKELLTPKELTLTVWADLSDVLLWMPWVSKGELLGALTAGDGQGFVDLFVSQFDLMARFVPVLDKVFQTCLTAKRE